MKCMTKIDTLYSRKLGRLSFLKNVLMWPLRLLLHKQSDKHIAENRRQLVVFSFDHIAHTVNLDGVYEKDDLDTFFAWLRSLNIDTNSSMAIDIGANIGNHSLYFSDYFRKVYSFEPNPRTFKVLLINAELTNNIECFNYGLSDEAKTATLSINKFNIGGATISETSEGILQTIELKTLDSKKDIDNVMLIKIDVEGHEYNAINGARNVIQRDNPIIIFEQHISDFKNGESPVLILLNELGYKSFATIRKYPRVEGGLTKKMIFVPTFRLILGESIEIKIEDHIMPGYYPFIVALPEWFPLKAKVV